MLRSHMLPSSSTYIMPTTHQKPSHAEFVNAICVREGFARSSWKKAVRTAIIGSPWDDSAPEDLADFASMGESVDDPTKLYGEAQDFLELIDECPIIPNGYRIKIEDHTYPMHWTQPTFVLEFLEVELSRNCPDDRLRWFMELFAFCDNSAQFHFRVLGVSRFGIRYPIIDETTWHDVFRYLNYPETLLTDTRRLLRLDHGGDISMDADHPSRIIHACSGHRYTPIGTFGDSNDFVTPIPLGPY